VNCERIAPPKDQSYIAVSINLINVPLRFSLIAKPDTRGAKFSGPGYGSFFLLGFFFLFGHGAAFFIRLSIRLPYFLDKLTRVVTADFSSLKQLTVCLFDSMRAFSHCLDRELLLRYPQLHSPSSKLSASLPVNPAILFAFADLAHVFSAVFNLIMAAVLRPIFLRPRYIIGCDALRTCDFSVTAFR